MPRSQATILAPTFDKNVWYAVGIGEENWYLRLEENIFKSYADALNTIKK
jgi:hypothetical protein